MVDNIKCAGQKVQEVLKSCDCGKKYRITSYYAHRTYCKVAKENKLGSNHIHKIAIARYADKLQREVKLLQENESGAERYGDSVFPCSYCGVTFSSQYYLDKHDKTCMQKVYELKDRQHVCCVCSKRFTCSSNLYLHMDHHREDRPFKCELCDKKFKTARCLKSHVPIHMDEKLWECKVCNKSFKQRQCLDVHIKVHTENKPFICQFCGKRLSRIDSLKNHIRIHTGEKPYKCINCDKCFTHSKQLHLHRAVCFNSVDISEVIIKSEENPIV